MSDAHADSPERDAITAAVAASIAGATTPIDEELWERRMKALTLRNAGATFAQIGVQLHVSATVARADVRQALREVLTETTEDFIARQRSVLLDMQRAAYPGAMRGDRDSIVSIVKCLEQEAKLLGLYAPARVAVGIGDVDFAEQAAGLIAKLGLQPPKELMHGARSGSDDAALAAEAAGLADALEASIVDGLVERWADHGFDIPAVALELEPDPLDAEISDTAIGEAAAAAIDPDRFGVAGDSWSNL